MYRRGVQKYENTMSRKIVQLHVHDQMMHTLDNDPSKHGVFIQCCFNVGPADTVGVRAGPVTW